MEPHNQTPTNTKQERWLARKKEKEARRHRPRRNASLKRWSIWFLVLGVSGGLLSWWAVSQKQIPEGDIVARNGLHWHPQLTITINGQDQEIPASIGLGGTENPIHTHDATGTIHEEFQGVVTRDDLRLGKFFSAWNKKFTSTCIFDKCNGDGGQMTMTVNGKANTEFDQYVMHDKDKIVIRFE